MEEEMEENSLDKPPMKLPTNFTELPEEISIKIFSYLKERSLMESRLVCKSWNKVILSSPKLMEKIPLKISRKQIKEFNKNLELSRGHQSICFLYINNVEIPKDFIEGLERISSDVTTVNFIGCEDSEIIHTLFECFPSAEHVEIEWPHYNEDAKMNPEVFARCKTLEVACYENFDCFEDLQLTKLKLSNIDSHDWPLLFDFLSKQTRLSALAVHPICEIPSDLELPQIKCRVEDLEINGNFIRNGDDILNEKLIEFIELFGESVKSLKILDCCGDCCFNSFNLFSSIIKTCKSLVKLELSGFNFSSYIGLVLGLDFDQLQPLQHVKKVSLGLIKYETETELKEFLNLFPHLSEIEIDSLNTFVSNYKNKFFRSFFDRENLQNFPAGLKTIKMKQLSYPEDGQIVKVENKFMRLTIHFKTKFFPLFQFNLALKLFEIFDLPKEGLMKTQHITTDMPEWKEVTEEDFAQMRRNEPYDLSILSHCVIALLIEKLNI